MSQSFSQGSEVTVKEGGRICKIQRWCMTKRKWCQDTTGQLHCKTQRWWMIQRKLCLDARGQCTYRLTGVVIAFTRSVQAQVRQNPSKKRAHEHRVTPLGESHRSMIAAGKGRQFLLGCGPWQVDYVPGSGYRHKGTWASQIGHHKL